MTAAQILEKINSPEKLGMKDEQDLLKLSSQYPYAYVLHALRLKALVNGEQKDIEAPLAITSAYSPDRVRLFDLLYKKIEKIVPQSPVGAGTSIADKFAASIVSTQTLAKPGPVKTPEPFLPPAPKHAPISEAKVEVVEPLKPIEEVVPSPLVLKEEVRLVENQNFEDKLNTILSRSAVSTAGKSAQELLDERLNEISRKFGKSLGAENKESAARTTISVSESLIEKIEVPIPESRVEPGPVKVEEPEPIAADPSINEEVQDEVFAAPEPVTEQSFTEEVQAERVPEAYAEEPIPTPEPIIVPEAEPLSALITEQKYTPPAEQSTAQKKSFGQWLKAKPQVEAASPSVQPEQPLNSTEPIDSSDSEKKNPKEDIIERFIQTEPRIEPRKAAFYKPVDMAKQSVEERDDTASETLANIYAQQGYHQKAIQMYKNLSLRYPEKSTYFAALIEALITKE